MSLKSFHVIFIVCSIILALFFGWWAIVNFQQKQLISYLWTAIGSIAVAIELIVYEILFLKKVRH